MISKVQEIEWMKQMKTEVCGVDSEKLTLKLKRKLVKLVGERPLLKFYLDKKETEGLWDTGAMISLLNRDYVENNFPESKILTIEEFMNDEKLILTTANKQEMKVSGVVVLNFSIDGDKNLFEIPFLVTEDTISRPILGFNTIEYLVQNFQQSLNLPASMITLFGTQLTDKPEVLVATVEEGSKIGELVQETKVKSLAS